MIHADPKSPIARRDASQAARAAVEKAAGHGAALIPETLRREQPLVPADSIAGRALVTVIAILTFLAALTAGAAELVASASADWRELVAREMTIQVRPDPQRNVEADLATAVTVVRAFPGVAGVKVFSKEEAERLLEPWLGSGVGLAELPVPRLIVVETTGEARPNLEVLRTALRERVPTATVDDHQMWIERLATMANTVIVLGVALVVLVLTATGLAVAFATHAAVAGNREIVEVLHFVGADGSFIARAFQARFLRLGLKGGAIGGGLAVLLIALVGALAGSWRASPHGHQLEAMFGGFEIGWRGYAAVLLIAVVVAAVTAVTSRLTVRRHLAKLY